MSVGESESGAEGTGTPGGEREILFGLVHDDPRPRLKDKLGEDVTHLGSLKVAMSGNVTVGVAVGPVTVSVTPTLDFYTDADGHVHVVVGSVQPDGTWEIVADVTIPFL